MSNDKLVIGCTYKLVCGDDKITIGYLAHSLDQDCFAIVGAVNGMRSRFPVAIEFYRSQVLTVKDSVIMLRTQDDVEGL